MKRDRPREGSRRHVVRAAKGGQEVVERFLVCQIDDREARAPFVPIAVKQVVVPDRQVEEVARCDARRIVVIVLGAGRRNLYQG